MSGRALLLLLLAGLGYVVMPLDLIPDVPGVGWLDDVVVLLALGYVVAGYLRTRVDARTPDSTPRGASDADWPADAFDARFGSSDPRVVLGVGPAAGPDEVKQAYRKLLAEYHPDKVSHLSSEFQALAHERAVAIQRAYGQVMER